MSFFTHTDSSSVNEQSFLSHQMQTSEDSDDEDVHLFAVDSDGTVSPLINFDDEGSKENNKDNIQYREADALYSNNSTTMPFRASSMQTERGKDTSAIPVSQLNESQMTSNTTSLLNKPKLDPKAGMIKPIVKPASNTLTRKPAIKLTTVASNRPNTFEFTANNNDVVPKPNQIPVEEHIPAQSNAFEEPLLNEEKIRKEENQNNNTIQMKEDSAPPSHSEQINPPLQKRNVREAPTKVLPSVQPLSDFDQRVKELKKKISDMKNTLKDLRMFLADKAMYMSRLNAKLLLEEDPLRQLQDVQSLTTNFQNLQVSQNQLVAKVSVIDTSIQDEIQGFINGVSIVNE